MMLDLLRYSLQFLRWHKLLPTTRWGDRAYARLHCLRFNGYPPREKGGDLTDFLAFMKGHPEMETPLRQRLSDKAQLKLHVAHQLGPAYCLPTYGILTTRAEVDAFQFPTSCVIKTTHSSGQIMIRKTGEPVDRQRLKDWLKINHYLRGRERNYRGLEPKIMVEDWVDLSEGWQFKAHCIRGKPIDIQMFRDQGPDTRIQVMFYLDADGIIRDLTGPQAKEARRFYAMGAVSPLLPADYPEILRIASIMAKDMLYARVDMFWTREGIWINEITTSNINGVRSSYGARFEEARGIRLFGPRGFCLEDFPELH